MDQEQQKDNICYKIAILYSYNKYKLGIRMSSQKNKNTELQHMLQWEQEKIKSGKSEVINNQFEKHDISRAKVIEHYKKENPTISSNDTIPSCKDIIAKYDNPIFKPDIDTIVKKYNKFETTIKQNYDSELDKQNLNLLLSDTNDNSLIKQLQNYIESIKKDEHTDIYLDQDYMKNSTNFLIQNPYDPYKSLIHNYLEQQQLSHKTTNLHDINSKPPANPASTKPSPPPEPSTPPALKTAPPPPTPLTAEENATLSKYSADPIQQVHITNTEPATQDKKTSVTSAKPKLEKPLDLELNEKDSSTDKTFESGGNIKKSRKHKKTHKSKSKKKK